VSNFPGFLRTGLFGEVGIHSHPCEKT